MNGLTKEHIETFFLLAHAALFKNKVYLMVMICVSPLETSL
jgi:hypothetical protein